jgi:hypothetical protein
MNRATAILRPAQPRPAVFRYGQGRCWRCPTTARVAQCRMLDNSATILQDDSGIPLADFEAKRWRLQAFGRVGVDPGGQCIEGSQPTSNSYRHRDRPSRSRRSGQYWRGAGARHRWRDAEPGGALTEHCRTEHGRNRGKHAKAPRQSLRARRARITRPQGRRWPGAVLGGAAAELDSEPL